MDDAGLQPLIFGLGEWVNVLQVELGWVAWFVSWGEGVLWFWSFVSDGGFLYTLFLHVHHENNGSMDVVIWLYPR